MSKHERNLIKFCFSLSKPNTKIGEQKIQRKYDGIA